MNKRLIMLKLINFMRRNVRFCIFCQIQSQNNFSVFERSYKMAIQLCILFIVNMNPYVTHIETIRIQYMLNTSNKS